MNLQVRPWLYHLGCHASFSECAFVNNFLTLCRLYHFQLGHCRINNILQKEWCRIDVGQKFSLGQTCWEVKSLAEELKQPGLAEQLVIFTSNYYQSAGKKNTTAVVISQLKNNVMSQTNETPNNKSHCLTNSPILSFLYWLIVITCQQNHHCKLIR